MRYWDTSALVPLIFPEAESERMKRLYAQEPEICTWVFTPVELASALSRRRREGIPAGALLEARRLLLNLQREWREIREILAVREQAIRLLDAHPLRAADALQLAAALAAAGDRPESVEFVTLDDRLAEAARREGFKVKNLSAAR